MEQGVQEVPSLRQQLVQGVPRPAFLGLRWQQAGPPAWLPRLTQVGHLHPPLVLTALHQVV